MLYESTVAVLLLMQALIVWECIRMKGVIGSESGSLRQELTGLCQLVDEALDYFSDVSPKMPNPAIAQTGMELKEILLTSLMNKMLMQPEHGNPQESQEWQVHENQPENIKEEIV